MNIAELFDEYSDKTVKIVVVPLPPTPTNTPHLIYMPDCFTSDILDYGFDRTEQLHVVTGIITKLGPAFLAFVKLGDLVTFGKDNYGQFILKVLRSACCATVSLVEFEGEKTTFATMAKLDKLSFIARSCHPGSHVVIPQAPFLTSFLQYAQAPSINVKEFRNKNIYASYDDVSVEEDEQVLLPYMTPEEAEILFPSCDFSGNMLVDNFISKCAIDMNVSFSMVRGGLGRWSMPCLWKMRRNLIGESHDRQSEVLGNADQEGHGESQGSSLQGRSSILVQ